MKYIPHGLLGDNIRDFIEKHSEEFGVLYLEFAGHLIKPEVLRLVGSDGTIFDLLPYFSEGFLTEKDHNTVLLCLENHGKRKNRQIIERLPVDNSNISLHGN